MKRLGLLLFACSLAASAYARDVRMSGKFYSYRTENGQRQIDRDDYLDFRPGGRVIHSFSGRKELLTCTVVDNIVEVGVEGTIFKETRELRGDLLTSGSGSVGWIRAAAADSAPKPKPAPKTPVKPKPLSRAQRFARAASDGRVDEVRRLLKADPNLAKRKGAWTDLHFAVSSGSAPTVKVLLDAGADVEARTDEGLTPLMLAVYLRKASVVPALLAAGASMEATNRAGKTALQLAEEFGATDATYAPVLAALRKGVH